MTGFFSSGYFGPMNFHFSVNIKGISPHVLTQCYF